jgi:hypothetical protein
MKNKIIVVIVPILLSILLSLYLTFSGTSLLNAILTPVTGCGLLLGLSNLAFLSQPTLKYILINVILGMLIFCLLYFGNNNFLLEYFLMGAVVGLITGVVNSLFIRKQ